MLLLPCCIITHYTKGFHYEANFFYNTNPMESITKCENKTRENKNPLNFISEYFSSEKTSCTVWLQVNLQLVRVQQQWTTGSCNNTSTTLTKPITYVAIHAYICTHLVMFVVRRALKMEQVYHYISIRWKAVIHKVKCQ